MKANTRALIAIGVGALALAWISVASHGSRSHDIALTEISESSVTADASVTATSASTKGARTIASVQPLIVADPQRAVGSAAKGSGHLAEATRDELLDVAILGRKAFLTDAEKLRRQSLMRDSVFLRDIAGLLRSRLIDQETLREQYQAIDFLLEARAGGSAGEAANLLRGIVSDPQVEDVSIPKAVRENLAGIKAEVLYEWTAREPDVASEIPENLPGPTSTKIWNNVRDQLSRNIAESNAMDAE